MATNQSTRVSDFDKQVSKRIDKLMKQAETGIGKKLSKALNVNEAQISKYRNGKSRVPVEDLAAIAKYFNVSTDYLITGKDYTQEKKQTDSASVSGKLDNGDSETVLLALATLLICTEFRFEMGEDKEGKRKITTDLYRSDRRLYLTIEDRTTLNEQGFTMDGDDNFLLWWNLAGRFQAISDMGEAFNKSEKYGFAQKVIEDYVKNGRLSAKLSDYGIFGRLQTKEQELATEKVSEGEPTNEQ